MIHAPFDSIESAIEDLKQGKFVVVVDDEDRENEGDVIAASECVTPEMVNFMAKEARGLICVSVSMQRARELELKPMVQVNTAMHETNFTISVDSCLHGVTTGISVQDRAITIQQLANPQAKANDFARPGHIFPLRAMEGGVLRRVGHTEAALDLAKLAGFEPSGVLCEILKEDGSMARVPDLVEFSKKHNLKLITIKDLVSYRMKREQIVHRAVETNLPTHFGDFKLIAYETFVDDKHHLALVKGEIDPEKPVLLRVHSQCATGDIFGSMRCDCGEQLATAMMKIEQEGCGVLLYMMQEGRGIGLVNKLKAYKLQDEGYDTVEANEMLGFKPDLRDYGLGAQILHDLGVKKMKLMTNNPKKVVGLEGYDLEVVERIPLEIKPNEINKAYLETKRDKMGHMFGTASGHDQHVIQKIIGSHH